MDTPPIRTNVLRMAGLIAKYNARLSYQTDYVVLDGIEAYEAALLAQNPAATNNKPLFRYLTEDLNVSLEPHAHECIPGRGNQSLCKDKAYNYADVVARIRQVTGLTPAAIMGGTSAKERSLEELTTCIAGNVFTTESWCPEALTVFAGDDGGHETGGDDLHSGVWRPKSLSPTTDFATDNPLGKVSYIGSGYLFSTVLGSKKVEKEPIDGVRTLLSLVDSKTIESGKILTTTVMIPEDTMLDNDLYDELETILADAKKLADEGRIVHATYPQVLSAWRGNYGSVANIVKF